MSKVIVIGGGPAGLMSAYAASLQGHQVKLFEKNAQFGKKLQLTGHGRCNVTNNCSKEEFFQHICHNEKFLYSSFSQFSNQDLLRFFKEHGLITVEEDKGRMFPSSQSAMDVILFFLDRLKENKVEFHTNEACTSLIVENNQIIGIETEKQSYSADFVIVSTGGLSFQQTGSTGDGLQWAKELGLKVTNTYPGLVSIHSPIQNLAGLSLKNIGLYISSNQKKLYHSNGDLLFTHQGISGPAILIASNYIINKNPTTIYLDFVPKQSLEQLDQRLLKAMQKAPNKTCQNVFEQLLPKRLVQEILNRIEMPLNQKVNQTNKAQRLSFVEKLKDFDLEITGFGSYNEAMVTIGGISTKEINPKTMESKTIKGLKFAGEILDLDGETGGYNLQIAWSTGYSAGSTINL